MVHKVLIFGASGLLMPHVIPHIVDKFDLEVTAFVRPGSKGLPALKELGIKVIEGSWTDEDLIQRTIEDFDIVWDVGDSASPALPKLLVPLIEQSAAKPTLIRFTGTGNFITQTGGNATTDAKEYDDSSAEDIGLLHDQMFNGAGDLIALKALSNGINVWVLSAGGVYGVPSAGVPSTGVFVRLYTNNALGLGYAPYIGDGSAHMQLIHIDDVISATDVFLEQVLPTVGKPVAADIAPHTRYFNAPGYSYTWKHIAETWSAVLSRSADRELPVKAVPMDQAGFIAPLINAEMKAKAGKLAQLGWQPKGPSLEVTLPGILPRGISLPLA